MVKETAEHPALFAGNGYPHPAGQQRLRYLLWKRWFPRFTAAGCAGCRWSRSKELGKA